MGMRHLALLAIFLALPAWADSSLTVKERDSQNRTNYPVQVARAFTTAEIANCPQAIVGGTPVTTDAVLKTSYTFSSVSYQFFIISFLIPTLNSGTTATITFQNQTCPTGSLTIANMTAAGFDFNAQIDVDPPGAATTQTVDARTMLSAGAYTEWVSGDDVAQTIIISSNTGAYDFGWRNEKYTLLTNSSGISAAATTMTVFDGTWIAAQSLPTKLTLRTYVGSAASETLCVPTQTVAATQPSTITIQRGITTDCAGTTAASAHGYLEHVSIDSQAETWEDADGSTTALCKQSRPIVRATFWQTINKVSVRFILEQSKTECLADYLAALTFKTGNAAPATVDTHTEMRLHVGSRLVTSEYWIGGAPGNVEIDHKMPYVISTGMMPNYDTTFNAGDLVLTETIIANNYTSWTATGRDYFENGGLHQHQPSAGGTGDIGPFTINNAWWLYSMDYRYEETVKKQAELAAAWPYHFRESVSTKAFNRNGSNNSQGRPISINGRPTLNIATQNSSIRGFTTDRMSFVGQHITLNGTLGSCGAGTSPLYPLPTANCHGWTIDDAHIPNPFYLLYVLTGDYYYLEEMYFSASWTGFEKTSNARGPAPAGKISVLTGAASQVRAQAWMMRERIQAAFLAPDSSVEETYFTELVNDTLAGWEGTQNITTGTFYDAATTSTWYWGRNTRALYANIWPPSGAVSPLHSWSGGTADGTRCYLIDPRNTSTAAQTSGASQGFSAWQQNFIAYVLDRAVELGFSAATLKTWLAPAIVNQVNNGGNGFDPYNVGFYLHPAMKRSTSDFFTAFDTTMDDAFDFAGSVLMYPKWVALTVYTTSDVVIPTTKNGFFYTVTVGGTSGASEPAWPTGAGSTVVNGTVTFARSTTDFTCDTTYLTAQAYFNSRYAGGGNSAYPMVYSMAAAVMANETGGAAAWAWTDTNIRDINPTGTERNRWMQWTLVPRDSPTVPDILAIFSGNNQTADISTQLASQLVVQVTNGGTPVAGLACVIAAASGGGSVNPASDTTDAQGKCQTDATLGPVSGTHTFTFSCAACEQGSPQTFSATATNPPVAAADILTLLTPTGLTSPVSQRVAFPFLVRATNTDGSVASSRTATFTVTAGGGSVATASTTTDSDGRANTAVTLGAGAGTNTFRVTIDGLTKDLSITGNAVGAATKIVSWYGEGQRKAAGSILDNTLVVQVQDADGDGVSGVSVDFAVASGGGSISITSCTTSALGFCATSLTLGGVAGSNTVTATSAGLTGSPLTFTTTGT